MLYLIIGRTGAGKDYIASLLQKRGMKAVKSYATRPKRNDTENTHIFISAEEAAKITDKVATTCINGYEYFATKRQVEESDIYVIDPKGLEELTTNLPDETFHVIYVEAEDKLTRKTHAVSRAENKIKEETIFDNRDDAENEMFTKFENKLRNVYKENFPKNITGIEIFENKYDNENAEHFAEYIANMAMLHNKMTKIVKEGLDLGIIRPNDNDQTKVNVVKKDGQEESVTEEHFAELLCSNAHGMLDFMKAYVCKSPRFDDLL